MKILYIAVHGHTGWGAEHWLAQAFERKSCQVIRYDYRSKRKVLTPWWWIKRQLHSVVHKEQPDVLLLQRAEKMPAHVVLDLEVPVFFWSTEPLNRRRDVDRLLAAGNSMEHIFLHTYTCLDVVRQEFPDIVSRCTVLHNAAATEVRDQNRMVNRSRSVVFNRNVSARRQAWLDEMGDQVDIVKGQFGNDYFATLADSKIALNIHYADSSVDDFETGIFEALACGAVVITETLNPRTTNDMGMENVLIQVSDALQMREAMERLLAQPEQLELLQQKGFTALSENTWDSRAEQLLGYFSRSL